MNNRTVVILFLSVVLLAVPGIGGCRSLANEEDAVKVVFVKWERGEGAITTKALKETDLTPEEIQSLASEHVSGSLEVVGYQIHGSGRNLNPRRILIIMDHQIDKSVDLRQPSNSNAIYLQLGSEWKLLPKDAVTSDRIIRFEVNREYDNQTMYSFQLRDGAMQGKTAFIW